MFDLIDEMAEERRAILHRMARRDARGRQLDRGAFGQRGFIGAARGIEFALVDAVQLHRECIAHDRQPDADQDREPGDRRHILFGHVGRERNAGKRRLVGRPHIDLPRRSELRGARGLLRRRVLLRQTGCGGRK
ncbi:MAG TPA: hypothetical protein PK217_12645, partial [Sphingopyxis terrae]|nr:hypothetical protein [Sphingopyxis terrae]